MKRKVIVGLGASTLAILAVGLYIALTIDRATSDLNQLVTLHQVENLREKYLLQLQSAQLDLALDGSPGSRSPEVVLTDVENVRGRIAACFGCHHPEPVTRQLTALQGQAERYHEALQRAFASRGAPGAPALSSSPAFRIGEKLVTQVRDLIDSTTVSLARETQRTLRAITRTKYVIYATMALGPVLAAALAFVVLSGLARPLGVLLASTRRLQAGDLDHRVGPLPDEFDELAVAFNDMAASLKENMYRVQRAEQMVLVGQLAAGLAHEIRNPLGGIKAAMQVLLEEGGPDAPGRDVLQSVCREIGRLESLMRSFLDFAKPSKPKLMELNVNELLSVVVAMYVNGRPHSEAADHLKVERHLEPIPLTLADPSQLQQILLNLILNAIESMPNGGTLTVGTRLADEAVEIEVSDTGRGVRSEHLDKIFAPFFTTKAKGTGLGLSITKQLVEQHGGSISVASRPTGGTSFRVRLPLAHSTPVAAA